MAKLWTWTGKLISIAGLRRLSQHHSRRRGPGCASLYRGFDWSRRSQKCQPMRCAPAGLASRVNVRFAGKVISALPARRAGPRRDGLFAGWTSRLPDHVGGDNVLSGACGRGSAAQCEALSRVREISPMLKEPAEQLNPATRRSSPSPHCPRRFRTGSGCKRCRYRRSGAGTDRSRINRPDRAVVQ
ncbi:hypothetical protein BH11PSE5_BH11PSE5_16380 [soil metagenome]